MNWTTNRASFEDLELTIYFQCVYNESADPYILHTTSSVTELV